MGKPQPRQPCATGSGRRDSLGLPAPTRPGSAATARPGPSRIGHGLGSSATTTDLARDERHCEQLPQHSAVLRESGLVTGERIGCTVFYGTASRGLGILNPSRSQARAAIHARGHAMTLSGASDHQSATAPGRGAHRRDGGVIHTLNIDASRLTAVCLRSILWRTRIALTPSQRTEAAVSFDTTVIAQDYVNVFELFDVARAAAAVERLDYTTWLHGTVRTLQTHSGPHAAQVVQRYDASGRAYPVDDDQPHGWAVVSLTTDDDDWARRGHDWFLGRARPLAGHPGCPLVLAASRRRVGHRQRRIAALIHNGQPPHARRWWTAGRPPATPATPR